jgi:hypothetical protein
MEYNSTNFPKSENPKFEKSSWKLFTLSLEFFMIIYIVMSGAAPLKAFESFDDAAEYRAFQAKVRSEGLYNIRFITLEPKSVSPVDNAGKDLERVLDDGLNGAKGQKWVLG